MNELISEIKNTVNTFLTESQVGYEKDNKSAQARARKASNQLTKLLKKYRDITLGRIPK